MCTVCWSYYYKPWLDFFSVWCYPSFLNAKELNSTLFYYIWNHFTFFVLVVLILSMSQFFFLFSQWSPLNVFVESFFPFLSLLFLLIYNMKNIYSKLQRLSCLTTVLYFLILILLKRFFLLLLFLPWLYLRPHLVHQLEFLLPNWTFQSIETPPVDNTLMCQIPVSSTGK